ncbi:plastocyanin/azurin family copper-binding protein [Rubricoccus marinus]|uniref:plastocyanin/azurin family copper-binding protein n=1 Tax=Rubricoccus marinus TaxID=716817 RepID=UPI000B97D2E7|nr:plastocyanin/azurin family copper-binding protein [Rubricoccus marinus]
MRALLLLTAFFAFSACGGGEVTPSPDQEAIFADTVDVELVVPAEKNAMAYAVGEISAPAGARVRLVMDNTETTSRAMIHNVVVLNTAAAIDRVGKAAAGAADNIPEDPAIVVNTPLAGPGERQAVVFTMPPPGRYPFICTYPGHFQYMQGVLVSTAPEAGPDEASGDDSGNE